MKYNFPVFDCAPFNGGDIISRELGDEIMKNAVPRRAVTEAVAHDTDVMIVSTGTPQGDAKLKDLLSEGYAITCRFGSTVILEK